MEGRGREGGGGGGKVGGWGAQTIEKIGFYTTQRTTIGQKETKTTGGPPPLPFQGVPKKNPKNNCFQIRSLGVGEEDGWPSFDL